MKKFLLITGMALLIGAGELLAQGCAAPSSDEGVTVWGYLQPEIQMNFIKDPPYVQENSASFRFRRMRIGVMGNIPYDFGYYVLLETSQFINPDAEGTDKLGALLLDAFVSYNRFQNFTIALGSFKYPFGRELSMPCHGLYTINRSKFVDELTANLNGGNRDIGLMFLGGSDSTLFTYRAAITNGAGYLDTDPNLFEQYTVTGRVTIQPIKGLYLGASARYGKNPAVAEGVEEDDTKMRFGFDAEYRVKNWTFVGEYIHGDDEGSYTEGGGCGGQAVTKTGSNESDGWFIMGLYRFPFNLEPVYKIESYETKKSDGGDIPAVTENSSVCQTFGLNYYPNDWTRLQANYVYRAESPNEIPNDYFILQVQVRF
jgi:hypothetical protein